MPGCKVGDLAIVINAICQGNIGTIVKVESQAEPDNGRLNWNVTSRKGSPCYNPLSQRIFVSGGGVAMLIDNWLVPIRPGLMSEDEIEELNLEFSQ